MRLDYVVHVNPAGGVEDVVLDLTAESEREELLLRLIERGEVSDKLTCRLQNGKILSTTIVIKPAQRTTYLGASWTDKLLKPDDVCNA